MKRSFLNEKTNFEIKRLILQWKNRFLKRPTSGEPTFGATYFWGDKGNYWHFVSKLPHAQQNIYITTGKREALISTSRQRCSHIKFHLVVRRN